MTESPSGPSAVLRALHARYCALTGLPVRYGYQFEGMWYLWAREGYTEHDLEMTINYLKASQRNRPDLLTPNLRLHKLIGDLAFFEERRAESEKVVRVKQDAAKASVLRATGRVLEAPEKPCRSAGDVLKAEEAFQAFVQLKGKL